MSIWDGDRNPINLKLPTMGGHYFWKTLESKNGYQLQQHKGTEHCRILDPEDIRVAWGDEGPMRARFLELTRPADQLKAEYGDVIGVHRGLGLYDHYGVYESDNCVYEYNASADGAPKIQMRTMKEFLGNSDEYFVLVFPHKYGAVGKIHVSGATEGLRLKVHSVFSSDKLIPIWKRIQARDYKLYSPDETILRALSRCGERKYNLVWSNCEHFAIWCKTGMSDSHQIDHVLSWLIPSLHRIGL